MIGTPLRLHATTVKASWVDYNEHLSEWAYLLIFGDNADAFFRFVGIDEAYRAAGHSLYTAETHLRHLREVKLGQRLNLTLQVLGITCVGRARRVLDETTRWAATRLQFGQPIGKFQGVGFQLADMATALEAADLLTLRAAARLAAGRMTDADAAMAKVYTSEMLGRVTDTAVQIFGGMGLMSELPIERWWRDARVERIWDGTSEIQRHIIARSLLRAGGG